MINYPNNPTGAVANDEFYREIISFSYEKNIVLCNDAAYNEIIEENKEPLSIMQYDKKTSVLNLEVYLKHII